MPEIVILDAKRTPIGKINGSLKSLTAADLGTIIVKQLLKTNHIDPQLIDQVIFGNAIQAGNGQNIARQIQINSDIPVTKTAYTVNQVCGSGLKAVHQAWLSLITGESNMIIAGGTESMSNAPYLNTNQRSATKFGSVTLYDAIEKDGLTDAFSHQSMGVTAETVAEKYQVSRSDQDHFALNSHQKAAQATAKGYFDSEIIPININDQLISTDESIRSNTSFERLSSLNPVFSDTGSVTAGNSAPLNDGASAIILSTEKTANDLNMKPLARIIGYKEVGIDPNVMGYAPYYAINQLLADQGLTMNDIDLFEINEAFASQSVAVYRDLHIPATKLNISGGALALGHPLGASGSRILTTLVHNLIRNNQKLGIASLCMGGGQGSAIAVEII